MLIYFLRPEYARLYHIKFTQTLFFTKEEKKMRDSSHLYIKKLKKITKVEANFCDYSKPKSPKHIQFLNTLKRFTSLNKILSNNIKCSEEGLDYLLKLPLRCKHIVDFELIGDFDGDNISNFKHLRHLQSLRLSKIKLRVQQHGSSPDSDRNTQPIFEKIFLSLSKLERLKSLSLSLFEPFSLSIKAITNFLTSTSLKKVLEDVELSFSSSDDSDFQDTVGLFQGLSELVHLRYLKLELVGVYKGSEAQYEQIRNSIRKMADLQKLKLDLGMSSWEGYQYGLRMILGAFMSLETLGDFQVQFADSPDITHFFGEISIMSNLNSLSLGLCDVDSMDDGWLSVLSSSLGRLEKLSSLEIEVVPKGISTFHLEDFLNSLSNLKGIINLNLSILDGEDIPFDGSALVKSLTKTVKKLENLQSFSLVTLSGFNNILITNLASLSALNQAIGLLSSLKQLTLHLSVSFEYEESQKYLNSFSKMFGKLVNLESLNLSLTIEGDSQGRATKPIIEKLNKLKKLKDLSLRVYDPKWLLKNRDIDNVGYMVRRLTQLESLSVFLHGSAEYNANRFRKKLKRFKYLKNLHLHFR